MTTVLAGSKGLASKPTSRLIIRFVKCLKTPDGAHYSILAIAAVILIGASSRLWLFFDDWAFLVPSEGQIWAPHVGHWSTSPFLIFILVRDVFGLEHFLPFVLPVIAAHLILVHLVWRVMKRVGVNPWIATASSLTLALLGAGAENIDWAFQVGFVGAMDLALGALLLFLRPRLRLLDAMLIIVFSILSLTFSGTSIPVLVAAGVVGWVVHGFKRTVALLSLPVIVYVAWYIAIGHTAPPDGRASGLTDLLYNVPMFAIHMLSDGFGKLLPVPIIGTIAICLIVLWGVIEVGRNWRLSFPAYATFIAAIIFSLMTAYSRVNLGYATALSGRYLYFVIAMMMPLATLALTRLIAKTRISIRGVLIIMLVIAVFNAGGMTYVLYQRASRIETSKERIYAALAIIKADPQKYPNSIRPETVSAPDITVGDLKKFEEKGWLEPGSYNLQAKLSALSVLDISTAPLQEMKEQQCHSTPASGIKIPSSQKQLVLDAPSGGSISVQLEQGSSAGDLRSMTLSVGMSQLTNASGEPLVLVGGSTEVALCGTSK